MTGGGVVGASVVVVVVVVVVVDAHHELLQKPVELIRLVEELRRVELRAAGPGEGRGVPQGRGGGRVGGRAWWGRGNDEVGDTLLQRKRKGANHKKNKM